MKKKALIFLCLAVLIGAVLGLVHKNASKEETTVSSEVVITTTEKEDSGSSKKNVKISLPLEAIPEEYRNNLQKYCEDYGYKSVTQDANGNVKIKMTSLSHDLLLTKAGMKVIGAVYEMENSKDFPCVKKIESIDTDNFREVIIHVDKAEYGKTGSKALEELSNYLFYYQMFCEEVVYRCEIVVVDAETKKIIETKTFER